MSSMELNKIFGAILLAGLIAMMSGFLADVLVAPEELEEPAYQVAVEDSEEAPDAETETEEPAGPEPVAPLLASADASAGEGLTRACSACHSFDEGGANGVGPNLWGVVNAEKARVDGYNYSEALASMEGVWDYEALNEFLYAPREYVPGTKMNYAGLEDVEDRANLIAYLRTLSDDPAPLPEEEG